MDIKEIKELKGKLECQIAQSIYKFQQETETHITDVKIGETWVQEEQNARLHIIERFPEVTCKVIIE